MVMLLPAKTCSTGCADSGAEPEATSAAANAARKVVIMIRGMATFPGRSGATCGAALQTRDRSVLRVWNDPGSALHRFALHSIAPSALAPRGSPPGCFGMVNVFG